MERVVVIAGASQGFGAHLAKAYAKQGEHVVLLARREDKLCALVDEIKQSKGTAFCFSCDIRNPESVSQCVEKIAFEVGIPDILINNAGAFVWKKFLEYTPEEWSRTVETNLTGAFFMSQAVAKKMVSRGEGGVILNVGSIHSHVGDGNVVAHCASKFGLLGLTQSMAEALRSEGIRVYQISPGSILPQAQPAEKNALSGKVSYGDLERVVLFLTGSAAQHLTGTVVDCFGANRPVIGGL